MKITFGEHKGKLLIDKSVPFSYLQWLLTCGKTSAQLKVQIRTALELRKNL